MKLFGMYCMYLSVHDIDGRLDPNHRSLAIHRLVCMYTRSSKCLIEPPDQSSYFQL